MLFRSSGSCGTFDGPVTVTIEGSSTAVLSAVCSNGAFSTISGVLGSGLYSATASQTDAAGNLGTSATVGFALDLGDLLSEMQCRLERRCLLG